MPGVTDLHVHIQPRDTLKPAAANILFAEKGDQLDFLEALAQHPRLLIEEMDRAGIWRVGLANYPSPEIIGATDEINIFTASYAAHDRRRLIPFGGLLPGETRDPRAAVDHLAELGIAGLKVHPPHQAFPANAYTQGLDALAGIYRRAEERGLPVMIHTGTSIFPGARSKWGNPLELDDVAIDFPELRIIMSHGGRPLWMKEAFFILRRHRNVWLDVSSIPPVALLDYFPRLAEIGERALWGSDWPGPGVPSLRSNLDQFMALPLEEPLKRRITVENSLALFPAA